MHCREVEEYLEQLDELEEGSLAELPAPVREHCSSCRECASLLGFYRAAAGRFTELEEMEPPAVLRKRVGNALAASRSPLGRLWRFVSRLSLPRLGIPAPVTVAALCVVLIVCGFRMIRRHGGIETGTAVADKKDGHLGKGFRILDGVLSRDGVMLAEGRRCSFERGKYKALRATTLICDNGNRLRLDGGSEFFVRDRSLETDKAIFLDKGRIWLDVRSGRGSLGILTPNAWVVVWGTVFQVAYDPAAGSTTVAVTEGCVKVVEADGGLSYLKAGQSLQVRGGEHDGVRAPVLTTLEGEGAGEPAVSSEDTSLVPEDSSR